MKAYTNVEQSRKLAEILPIETSDMAWVTDNDVIVVPFNEVARDNVLYAYIPCWSLAALRKILPWIININNESYVFTSHNTIDRTWVYMYINQKDQTAIYQSELNEVDACYEVILKLNEWKLI